MFTLNSFMWLLLVSYTQFVTRVLYTTEVRHTSKCNANTKSIRNFLSAVKSSPITGLDKALWVPGGWGFQISRKLSHDGGYVCQPYAPAAFTPQEIFLVLISVTGRVNPRATVRPERSRQWNIPIETATFRFVAQCRDRATVYPLPCGIRVLMLITV
jgi:hypothetical protein